MKCVHVSDNKAICVSEASLCDGFADCLDARDENETMCLDRKCPEGFVKCPDGISCTEPKHICDGSYKTGCPDGGEHGCENFTCPEESMKCADGKECVVMDAICTPATPIIRDYTLWCADRSSSLCDDPCVHKDFQGR